MMRRLIVAFFFVAPLIAIPLWLVSPPAAIAVVFVSHMLVLYPTLRPSSQWLGPVVRSFATESNEVWLTIDDGPDARQTPQILSLLRSHGAAATFFVKGVNLDAHPELAREITAAGSELANHSYSHPSGTFWALPSRRIAREIDRCQASIAATGVAPPSRFRAPVGMKNPFVHPLLARRNLRLIGWSARAFDGVGAVTADKVLARLDSHIRPGAIILLHEGRPNNVTIVEALLVELKRRGFRAVVPADSQLRTTKS